MSTNLYILIKQYPDDKQKYSKNISLVIFKNLSLVKIEYDYFTKAENLSGMISIPLQNLSNIG